VLSAALLGFTLGLRHALDPDHVAAIAALVARHGRIGVAARLGAAWGLGHSLTIVAIGGILVALRIAIEPRWTLAAELVVASILIALGIANLRRLRRPQPAPGSHAHDVPAARALGIGVAHGLGGSAAVALLALAAMPTTASAVAYLAVFGLGTVGGMLLLSLGLGLPMCAASRRPDAWRWALAGSGALSIGAGLFLAYSVSTTVLL
jgi:high-affinity nickel-transport protein